MAEQVEQLNFQSPPAVLNAVLTAEIVPFHASVVSQGPESVTEKLARYEQSGLALFERMVAISVTDQETYDLAAGLLKEERAFSKETTEFFEPIREITYGMYQRVLEIKKGIQGVVQQQASLLSKSVIDFERKQEAERQRLQRELEERQRREQDELKLQAAAAAEAAGCDEASMQTILNAPDTTPKPIAPPTFQRVSNVIRREAWAAEVTDLWALVKAVAKDKKLLPLLEANMPALNAQARSLKTAMQIPGVRAVDKGSVAVRG